MSWAYDAVGNRTTAAGQPLTVSAFGNPFLFTGREWDAELGLYYYRARYYKPSLGRFISRDPVFADLYRYVGNNPVTWSDPWGLDPFFRPVNTGVQGGNLVTGVPVERTISISPPGPIVIPEPMPAPEPGIIIDGGDNPPKPGVTDRPAPGVPGPDRGGNLPPDSPGDDQCIIRHATKGEKDNKDQGNTDEPTRTPARGKPNSVVQLPNGTVRVYGPDGRAIKDIDAGHNHGAGDPHIHDWDWDRDPPRQPGRLPLPGEIQ